MLIILITPIVIITSKYCYINYSNNNIGGVGQRGISKTTLWGREESARQQS